MSSIDILRDALYGNPPSDNYRPSRAGLLEAFGMLSNSVSAAVSGVQRYADLTALNADTTQDNGTLGYVYNNNGSASDNQNGFYQFVGGAWGPAPWFFGDGLVEIDQIMSALNALKRSPEVQSFNSLGVFDPDGIFGSPSISITGRYYAIQAGVAIDVTAPVKLPLDNTGVVTILALNIANSTFSLVPFASGGFALPSQCAVLAVIFNGQIATQLPFRRADEGLQLNQFVDGRTMNGPDVRTFADVGAGYADVPAGALTALGMVRGWRGAIGGRAVIGHTIADPYTKGSRLVMRYSVYTTVDDAFGDANAFFWRNDQDSPIGGTEANFVLEQKINSREAIYRAEFINPHDRFDYFYIGRTAPAGAQVTITGMQFHASKLPCYDIRKDDFPSVIPPSGLVFDETLFAVPDDLWVEPTKDLQFFLDNLSGAYTGSELIATIEGDVASGAGRSVSFRNGDTINPDLFDSSALFTVRRVDSIEPKFRKTINIRKSQPGTGKTVRYAQIGDSLTNRYVPTFVQQLLQARGFTASTIGTIQGLGGAFAEGREGKQWGEHTYQLTTLPPPSSVSAYNALSQFDKQQYNPFIRPVVSGDSDAVKALAYNGYVFDYAAYLAAYGLQTPTHVTIALGTNDISYSPSNALDQIANGARVMVPQILAVNADIRVALVQYTVARDAGGNARLSAHNAAQRELIDYIRTLSNGRASFIPVYAHQSRDAGWDVNVVTTADDTGLQTVTVADNIHFNDLNRYVAAEIIANWIGATTPAV